MASSEGKVRRRRRSADEWRALVTRFEGSNLGAAAFCLGEGISVASLHRWRGLLAGDGDGRLETAPSFVDLGALAPGVPGAPAGRLEVKLDLGGGMVLHLVRG